MSKGKAKVNYLHREGLIGNSNMPDWSFLYEVSLIKAPTHEIGDRVVLPDGREFAYSKSYAACVSGQGAEFVKIGLYGAVAATAGVIGDKSIAIVAGTHDAVTQDELRGGYVVIHNASNCQQTRGIIGNDVSIANAALTVYMDAPLVAAVSTSILVEVFQNPFAALRTGTDVAYAKAGVPAAYVSAASMYFWCQTKGFCFSAPQSGITGKTKGACWRYDGSLDTTVKGICNATGDNGGDANVASQYAGYSVMGSADLVGPLFYLQG